MGCQLAGDAGGGSRSCENPGGKSDRDVRVRRGFLEEVTSGTRHAERGASQAEVDEGEREEGDDIAGRGHSTCEVPGTGSGRGRLGGREAQRPWEGTGDLAAFSSRPEGDGKPPRGSKGENDRSVFQKRLSSAAWLRSWRGPGLEQEASRECYGVGTRP